MATTPASGGKPPPFPSAGGLYVVNANVDEELQALDLLHNVFTLNESERRSGLQAIMLKLLAPGLEASFVKPLLRTVGRVAYCSPLEDVREAFMSVVTYWTQLGFVPPRPSSTVSRFVSHDRLPSIFTDHPVVRGVFLESFVQTGRVTNMLRVLAWHPQYIESFYKAFEFIMRAEGPLPVQWRTYIALMAASRHRCRYLVAFEELMFLWSGGSEEWLRGLQFAPKKLQDLAWLNAYLAHQPWMINKERVEQLARGADAWSMTELVQAIVILTTFHSLASLAYGCGLVSDDETEQEVAAAAAPMPVTPTAVDDKKSREETERLFNKLRAHDDDDPDAGAPVTAVDRREAFAQAGLDGEVGTTPDLPQIDLFDRYCGDVTLVYQDFDMRASSYRMFRLQEYCWSDHGFDLVGRFYSGAAQLLDDEFTVAFNMTDRQLNENKDVDTDKFRSAIWYYTQRVYGMSNDDYDYGEVNYLVSRELKTYVKKVTCYPERVTFADFMNMGLILRPEERCHINLLALEARKQASLLYGLHAVMQFMSSR